jgi:hypothetical protein
MAAMISVADYNSSNPLRPVDWRYRAAAERVASGLAFPRRDWDRETLETAYYLAGLRRGEAPRRLAADFPELHIALAIYQDRQRGHRWALEARLIAGIETASVATSLGVAPAVITTYQSVCFDVDDRLANTDFVIRRILSRPSRESYDYRDSGWKLLGYLGGPEALSQLLGRNSKCELPGIIRGQCSATKLAIADHIRRMVKSLDWDRRLVQDLPQILGCLPEAEAIDEYIKTIQQLLFGIKWSVISEADLKKDPELVRPVEMRADEQWLAALGLPNPTWDEVKDLDFDKILAERTLPIPSSVGRGLAGAAE